MAPGLFNRIFRSNKKNTDFDDYRRGASFRPNETFAEGASGLKASMRRRDMYKDEPLINPTAPYHYDIKPQRHKGPRSLPPQMMNDYSPNASPSSSTDMAVERSFQSEVQHRRKKPKYVVISPPQRPVHRHQESTRRKKHKEFDPSDSENTFYEYEMKSAFDVINSYKTKLKQAIEDKRRVEFEKNQLEFQYSELRRSRRKLLDEVNDLRQDNLRLKSQVLAAEAEFRSLQSNYYSFSHPHAQPSSFMFQPPPDTRRMYSFNTPSNNNQRIQLNNTNTGNSTLVASTPSGFKPPPAMGDGCGESLAFMSGLPGGNDSSILPEKDEVKVFRREESSIPSRPPTNCISNQSFELSSNSDNLRVSTSLQSTPENKSEKTPTASQKTQTDDPLLLRFERMVISQALDTSAGSPAKTTLKRFLSTSDVRLI